MLLTNLMILLTTAVIILIVFIEAITPVVPNKSIFELQRLADGGSHSAKLGIKRWYLLSRLNFVKRLAVQLLVISLTVITTFSFGLGVGVFITIIVILFLKQFSKISVISNLVNKQYKKYENNIFAKIEPVSGLLSIIGYAEDFKKPVAFCSKEELLNIIESSDKVINPREKLILKNSLAFGETKVASIMTTWEDVVTIDGDSLLGPILLNDLHETGHTRFPITSTRNNSVLGVVDIRELLSLKKTTSTIAKDSINIDNLNIDSGETIENLIKNIVTTKVTFFIVVEASGLPIGIVTIRDVFEALLGKFYKI